MLRALRSAKVVKRATHAQRCFRGMFTKLPRSLFSRRVICRQGYLIFLLRGHSPDVAAHLMFITSHNSTSSRQCRTIHNTMLYASSFSVYILPHYISIALWFRWFRYCYLSSCERNVITQLKSRLRRRTMIITPSLIADMPALLYRYGRAPCWCRLAASLYIWGYLCIYWYRHIAFTLFPYSTFIYCFDAKCYYIISFPVSKYFIFYWAFTYIENIFLKTGKYLLICVITLLDEDFTLMSCVIIAISCKFHYY